MPDLLTTISNEWQVIKTAPWSFGVAATAVAVAVWGVLRWTYAERIETLNARLLARDDEIKTLTGKLADALTTPKPVDALTIPELVDAVDIPKAAQPADTDDIEQTDRVVGRLNDPKIYRSEGLIIAKSITATDKYNHQKPFTFRGMQVKLTRWHVQFEGQNAGDMNKRFQPAFCEILEDNPLTVVP